MENSKSLRSFALSRRAQPCVRAFAARLFALVIVLSAFVLIPSGCGRQLGETKAEARRRHIRNDRIARDAMMADVDAIMMWDSPTKLTGKRIP